MTILKQSNFYNSLRDQSNHFLNKDSFPKEPFTPYINVKETRDNYELYMAVPGLHKEDIKIELDSCALSISSEKEMEITNSEHEKYTHVEFRPTPFKRIFSLPENTIDEDHIEASYNNGILSIVLPKKEEAKPTTIQISIN